MSEPTANTRSFAHLHIHTEYSFWTAPAVSTS